MAEACDSAGAPLARGFAALVEPYADFFAYSTGAGGNAAALIEGLLRLETMAAAIEARIAPLWHDLARSALTVAEDENKQRADRLFGLDGRAGLLGEVRRLQRLAAQELPHMSEADKAAFLGALIAFVGAFLPGDSGAVEHSGVLALPVYLQALALVVLVRDWIAAPPGLAEQAAISRHRAFLLGAGCPAGPVVAAFHAAAQALAR
ncbi:hypothetical protein [Novosphingobium sp.]|uniref:hypothetical protein n=1 Tax=Novosphingobium sp. TaxID=1874826 RepID=UPI003BA88C84